jgi:hypothetical protein
VRKVQRRLFWVVHAREAEDVSSGSARFGSGMRKGSEMCQVAALVLGRTCARGQSFGLNAPRFKMQRDVTKRRYRFLSGDSAGSSSYKISFRLLKLRVKGGSRRILLVEKKRMLEIIDFLCTIS